MFVSFFYKNFQHSLKIILTSVRIIVCMTVCSLTFVNIHWLKGNSHAVLKFTYTSGFVLKIKWEYLYFVYRDSQKFSDILWFLDDNFLKYILFFFTTFSINKLIFIVITCNHMFSNKVAWVVWINLHTHKKKTWLRNCNRCAFNAAGYIVKHNYMLL